MTKLNPYYIKNVEKLPKTEQIIYLDQNYQPLSYEEFMKTYEPSEEVEIITEAEYQDRVLYGPQYGPGNEQSSSSASSREREAKRLLIYMGKQVGDIVLNEIIGETVGYSPFIGLGMTQLMMSEFAKQGDSKELKELSEKLANDGMSMLRSGAMGTLSELASHLSNELSEKGLNKTADFVEAAQEAYKTYENTKPYLEVIKHFAHLNEGKEYLSGCKVCEE